MLLCLSVVRPLPVFSSCKETLRRYHLSALLCQETKGTGGKMQGSMVHSNLGSYMTVQVVSYSKSWRGRL